MVHTSLALSARAPDSSRDTASTSMPTRLAVHHVRLGPNRCTSERQQDTHPKPVVCCSKLPNPTAIGRSVGGSGSRDDAPAPWRAAARSSRRACFASFLAARFTAAFVSKGNILPRTAGRSAAVPAYQTTEIATGTPMPRLSTRPRRDLLWP